jgi:hypothetical protein
LFLHPHAQCCCCCPLPQIAAAEEEVDRLNASKASAQAEADEADAAAQQALETGHAEVRLTARLAAGWLGGMTEGGHKISDVM